MEKHLGKDIASLAQRESFLKDNCDKVENKGYMKQFSPEQLQGHKESLADLSIKIEQVEGEKKEASAYFKAALDPLTKERREMVSNIRQKAEYVSELCYMFIDREEKQTGYYNAEGDLIELRPSTADELQPTLFVSMQKTGTND